MNALLRRVALALLVAAASGCATLPPDAGKNPDDPWEVYNRNASEFNRGIDTLIVKPLAVTYETLVPQPLRTCVGNILDTISTVPTALNKLLQGDPDGFGAGMSRVLLNATIGIGGCFDPASDFDIPKLYSDFGVTLGKWGVPAGPYFVLPLLGPSTVRDAAGRIPGEFLNPQIQLRQASSNPVFFTLDVLDTRTRLFPLEKQLDDSGLDRYTAVRDAFLQRRRTLVDREAVAPLPVYEDPGDAPPPAK
ncbi:MAG: VacJ family lipoprotein [Betaproteobacteria bacterium]